MNRFENNLSWLQNVYDIVCGLSSSLYFWCHWRHNLLIEILSFTNKEQQIG